MREGVHPPFRDTALFRQSKPVLQRACAVLDITVGTSDTKAALVHRLRMHSLTQAQRDELQACASNNFAAVLVPFWEPGSDLYRGVAESLIVFIVY